MTDQEEAKMKPTLEEMTEAARILASVLFSTEHVPCKRTDGESCLTREEKRPLTKAEKDKGWYARPFYAYDTAKMCTGCEAYYHAERAAELLHNAMCWKVKIDAEAKRKQAEKVS